MSTDLETAVRRIDAAVGRETDILRRLQIVRDALAGRLVFTSSFGLEDQVILHALATAALDVQVVTFDTGRLFPETLDTISASATRYRIPIRVLAPDAKALEALASRDGVLGFRTSVAARQACCHVRKVEPLARALDGAAAWIVGLRRDQSPDRAGTKFAEWDAGHRLLKISPLADWSDAQVAEFIERNHVPINALHAQGFPSIGCAPCTRAVAPGDDPRSGRWWWENLDGKECGLHVRRQAEAAQ